MWVNIFSNDHHYAGNETATSHCKRKKKMKKKSSFLLSESRNPTCTNMQSWVFQTRHACLVPQITHLHLKSFQCMWAHIRSILAIMDAIPEAISASCNLPLLRKYPFFVLHFYSLIFSWICTRFQWVCMSVCGSHLMEPSKKNFFYSIFKSRCDCSIVLKLGWSTCAIPYCIQGVFERDTILERASHMKWSEDCSQSEQLLCSSVKI